MTEAHPQRLAGWRVLVPRAGEWGARAAARLRAEGADPVIVPLIAFAPPSDPAALAAAASRLATGEYDWVVFTSATTVSALAGAAGAHVGDLADAAAPGSGSPGPLVAVAPTTRVAAVGEATAEALELAGVDVDFVPESDFSARALVEEWPARMPGLRVFAPLSEIAAPTLVDGLRGYGLEVDEVGAYCTVTASPDDAGRAVLAGPLDAVLVTSGSVARALVELAPELDPSTVIACIGPRTAQEAAEAGLAVDVVAARQSIRALIDALAAAHHPHLAPTSEENSP
ncbi:uroporphyrinogen-III synthase [Ruicaihuangia caeni]|uniref:Uroporphyrinogen-III synthase n=1 Tax=Ruicaihuangia caeni TaxID=3042517 RepID=A0AAW6T9P6_9MICO|nr:uroporphyrinogen-III synthase [Klugiella sp. YN-L-19]MDI2098352.1 uroporphyrinogen-III synthase [Klugiella sp. YN-L-19]